MPYGDRRQICERVEVYLPSNINFLDATKNQISPFYILHFTFIILKTLFEQRSFITRKSGKASPA